MLKVDGQEHEAGEQLDDEKPERDPRLAEAAPALQDQVAEKGHHVVPGEGPLARRAVGRGADKRLALGQPVGDNVEKAADRYTDDEVEDGQGCRLLVRDGEAKTHHP